MKKLLSLLVIALLALAILPAISAVSVGSGVSPDITTEDFAPQVWMCDKRVVYDDFTEPGRYMGKDRECADNCNYNYSNDPVGLEKCLGLCQDRMLERINNYAFEGEQIQWNVLVMDKNGIGKVSDVFGTLGDVQGVGNDVEANCVPTGQRVDPYNDCKARILEENVAWNPDLMETYTCTLNVETSESMYGEYWITVEAVDLDGLSGVMAENEYWFLNPEILLDITGDLIFEDVRPGASAYSSTLLLGNDADDGSGVMLDMFISGTDFYDSSSSAAMCPSSNVLSLGNFRYFATNGAYSSQNDAREGTDPQEEYIGIEYGIGFNDPTPFYDNNEILQAGTRLGGVYYAGNLLAPGAEMAITFRLDLPEPCNGDFDTGSIYFWGEAI